MYNSVVVRVLVKIWNIILKGYEYSLLSKFNKIIIKKIKDLSKGSSIISLFTSNRSIIGESLFYDLYCKAINIVTNIFKALRRGIKNLSHGSIIYDTVYNLFSDHIQLQTTFYIFFISFSLGIVGNNIIRGFYSGKSYIISILLIFISFIGLSIKDDYKDILEGSYVYNFVKSIFTIDEGVNQWW